MEIFTTFRWTCKSWARTLLWPTPYISGKNVLLKQNEGPNKPEPFCKYCFKEFKKVGKSLFNHEAFCYFNPEIVKTLNLSSFKGKVLKSKGSCPKCYLDFPSKLRIHANSCFAGIRDFSKFLPRPESFSKSKKIIKSFDTTLLSQLPFFAFDGPLTRASWPTKILGRPNWSTQVVDWL